MSSLYPGLNGPNGGRGPPLALSRLLQQQQQQQQWINGYTFKNVHVHDILLFRNEYRRDRVEPS